MVATRRQTKAELKRARIEAAKAALAREQRRARILRIAIFSGAGVVVVALIVAAAIVFSRPSPKPSGTAAPQTPAGTAANRTSNPPWTAPADASAAVASAGLPMLGSEGTATHTHTHLDILANGSAVQVPAEIGIDNARQKISPLHTHDTSGVIHVESPDKSATFTLGQFFGEWQVSLGADHIGGLTTDATHELKVYVNGTLRSGDPAAITLAAHDEIAIVYGTAAQQASPPSSYQWTNGL